MYIVHNIPLLVCFMYQVRRWLFHMIYCILFVILLVLYCASFILCYIVLVLYTYIT